MKKINFEEWFKEFLKNKEELETLEELFKIFLKNKEDLETRNELIRRYKPLVKKIVYGFKYLPRVLTREDLFQEGILGLIKALTRYEDLGCNFETYAILTIKTEISELIRKSHSPSIPQKTTGMENVSFNEEQFDPMRTHYPSPHQIYMKQLNHERFLAKLKDKLSQNEFDIIRLSFGIPLGNINEDYQPCFSNREISQALNLTVAQVENFKRKAIQKLKK